MNLLSKWKIRPYIDLCIWEMHHRVEFPLASYIDTYTLKEFNRHKVVLELDGVEYIVSLHDFNEVMYQTEDAPNELPHRR